MDKLRAGANLCWHIIFTSLFTPLIGSNVVANDDLNRESGWRMLQGNMQRSSLSEANASSNPGKKLWVLTNTVPDPTAIIDANGTFYAGWSNYLVAINPDLKMKWQFIPQVDPWGPNATRFKVESTPALPSDGSICVGCASDGRFFSILPNGTKEWIFICGAGITLSQVVDRNGTAYFGSQDGYLYSILCNDSLNWKINIGVSFDHTSPALDSEGRVFICSNDGYLNAVLSNGSLGWKFFSERIRP